MNTFRRAAVAASVAGASLVGGAVGASLIGTAGAQTDDTTSTTTEQQAPQAPPQDQGQQGQVPQGQQPPQGQAPQGQPPQDGQGRDAFGPSGHSANGVTEQVLTGDEATKVTEAAQAAVDGGTVVRVETDAEGAAYEAHVRTADGTPATVKLDASFTVTSVEDGMR